jgi:hypothetical protein
MGDRSWGDIKRLILVFIMPVPKADSAGTTLLLRREESTFLRMSLAACR